MMHYIRFEDAKGSPIALLTLDLIPLPGDEIRIGDRWYVVEPKRRLVKSDSPLLDRHILILILTPRSRKPALVKE